ncbi:DUF4355 domain-containing protein [Paenibacillus sp. FSL H3-0333]|uniref:DUF4355 domain-containing protein n=1 Tax=Paenibacillus sp. FSL H3-0333 TaxID=2921373 RepID=UPI0030FC99FE
MPEDNIVDQNIDPNLDTNADPNANKEEPKTFTQDELNKVIGERLNKEKAKWEKDYSVKLESAKTEAEKLAKMNAEQKAEYEREQRENQLKERETELIKRELKAVALEQLADKGLPKQLAEIISYVDADATTKSIETVEAAFRAAVEQGVNERLLNSSKTPTSGGNNTPQTQAAATMAAIFSKKY